MTAFKICILFPLLQCVVGGHERYVMLASAAVERNDPVRRFHSPIHPQHTTGIFLGSFKHRRSRPYITRQTSRQCRQRDMIDLRTLLCALEYQQKLRHWGPMLSFILESKPIRRIRLCLMQQPQQCGYLGKFSAPWRIEFVARVLEI